MSKLHKINRDKRDNIRR